MDVEGEYMIRIKKKIFVGEDNPILYGWLGTMWANSRRIGDVQVS